MVGSQRLIRLDYFHDRDAGINQLRMVGHISTKTAMFETSYILMLGSFHWHGWIVQALQAHLMLLLNAGCACPDNSVTLPVWKLIESTLQRR